jgi:Ni,Fe-hydrogenase maturation factor
MQNILFYKEKLSEATSQLAFYKKNSFYYTTGRLLIFLALIALIYFGIHNTILLAIGCPLLIAAFLFSMSGQADYDKKVAFTQSKIAVIENEIFLLNGGQNIYYDGNIYSDPHHFYTEDLDIFGPHSLYQLINRARTFDGLNYLASLFVNLPNKEELSSRQEACKELESKPDWRIAFSSILLPIENGHKYDLAKDLEHQLENDMAYATQPSTLIYAKALPYIWVLLAILAFFKIDNVMTVMSSLFVLNLILVGRNVKQTGKIQMALGKTTGLLEKTQEAVQHILKEDWASTIIKNEVNLISKGTGKVFILSELKKIIDKLDFRLNLLVGTFLNGVFLWDYVIINKLNQWKKQHEADLTNLTIFVGKMEALTSLANWSFNNPDYCYPEVSESYFDLSGTHFRHPLIDSAKCVPNDFEIMNGQHLSIITGSNMSGKSTFLRTLGINVILAYAGTKCAAQSFSLPIVRLVSYMRIKDVLEENVSTFKAELDRISLILDLLKNKQQCLILIDEMLRGTNSQDKLTGSIAIAKRLLQEKSYSVIATHDIKLAEMIAAHPNNIQNYYFDITFNEGELAFDYKIKAGICQTFNASFLLKKLGIDM